MAQDIVPDQRTDDQAHSSGPAEASIISTASRHGSGHSVTPMESSSIGQSSSASDVDNAQAVRTSSVSGQDLSPALNFSEANRQSSGFLSGKSGLFIGLGVGLLLGVGIIPRFMGPNTDAAESTAPPTEVTDSVARQAVTVATTSVSQIPRTLESTGTVVASDLLPILAKSSGLQIQRVLVDEGDRVTAGQTLAVLDQSVINTQIAGAQADLQASKATVIQREAALAQSKARLAEAQANLERYQNLADQGAVSQEELDTRRTTAATAREEVKVAEANISSAQADVLSEEAQVRQLQTQLGQAVVTAPASGIVAERFARIGDVTSGSQALFSVIRDSLLELDVEIPETQLPAVQVGNTVAISSDADPQLRLQGQVREISPLIDPQTRQAVVTVSLPDSLKLRSGMFLKATLTTDTVSGLTVPAAAVLPQSDGGSVVYRLVDDGQVEAQRVEIGQLLDAGEPTISGAGGLAMSAQVEIVQGLQSGDRVVVEGASYMKDGSLVEVVEN